MNRYKATIILIIVSIGYLVSYPFQSTFTGGLLTSIFGASMIGGFADWYGITAIFGKPLGIPFKTNLIQNNRESIFDALSKMVSEELLTKEYLKALINDHDLSKLLLQYLEKAKNDKKLKIGISSIILDFLKGFNTSETGDLAAKTIIHSITQIKISRILFSAVEISIKSGYSYKIINFLIDQLIPFIKTRDFHRIIFELVEKVKSSYEKGSRRRAFINSVVLDLLLRLSSESMSNSIQIRLAEYLNDFKNKSSEDRLRFEEWVSKKIESYKEDQIINEKIDSLIIEHLNNLEIGNFIDEFLQSFRDVKLKAKGPVKRFASEVEAIVGNVIERVNSNNEMQRSVDESMKKILNNLIDNIHGNIGLMVKENLNKYSDNDIVELIESKVGDELQLVRINGSLVGGLVGMAIFLITLWIR